MRVLEGNVVGTGMKIGIVAARFNEFIVSKLVGGAEDALRRHEVDTENNVDKTVNRIVGSNGSRVLGLK